MGHLNLFSLLEIIQGPMLVFDTIFGGKKSLPQVTSVLLPNKKSIHYGSRKKGWNGYKQIACKFVEKITQLFNNNA